MTYDDVNLEAFDVSVAELLVATADEADRLIDPVVPEVLRLVREKMTLELVFVQVHRPEQQAPSRVADPLEAAWGEQVLAARCAGGSAGSFQCAPVVLRDGTAYGTLCAFATDEWAAHRDLRMLRSTATLIAHKMAEKSQGAGPAAAKRPGLGRSIFGTDRTQPLQAA